MEKERKPKFKLAQEGFMLDGKKIVKVTVLGVNCECQTFATKPNSDEIDVIGWQVRYKVVGPKHSTTYADEEELFYTKQDLVDHLLES